MDRYIIERVRSAAKIEAVFRHYGFTLKKSGTSFRTKCPFHPDREPSMSIKPSENICKCFPCGDKAMSPIDFVMKYENVPFIEAVKKLAAMFNVITDDSRSIVQRTTQKPTIMKPKTEYKRPTHEPVTDFSPKLAEYFRSRGISEATAKELKIGEGKKYIKKEGGEVDTIQFNFFRNGQLVNVKYRDAHKNFLLETGCEIIPYNIDAVADCDSCIITEGEFDCLSFVEIGHKNCISIPNGANSTAFLDDCIEDFERFTTIFIAVDTDKAGLGAREDLMRRLGAERCRIVTYGEGCKDANEHLVKYGRESLENCLTGASIPNISGIFMLDDYEEELDALYKEGLKKGYIIGHPNFDKLCSFETKRLCTVTGIPSSGKSEFIDEICWRLNNIYGFKVGYFSPENMPISYHASKIISKLCGMTFRNAAGTFITPSDYEEAKAYYRDNFFHILPPEGYTVENILDKAKALVRSRGIKILVIDPFNKIESEQSGRETETQYISRVIDKLTNFAQRHDLLVFLMVHPTKMRREGQSKMQIPDPYDINGSAHFYNKSDFIIIVHRDREKREVLVRVAKVKFRHLGDNGDATFVYNSINGRYVPKIEEERPHYDNTNYVGRKLPVPLPSDGLSDAADTNCNLMPFECREEKGLPY